MHACLNSLVRLLLRHLLLPTFRANVQVANLIMTVVLLQDSSRLIRNFRLATVKLPCLDLVPVTTTVAFQDSAACH